MIIKPLKYTLLTFLLIFTSQAAIADQTVSIKHHDLNLNANLKLADGKTIQDDIILITHGTLAHGKMEITSALQKLFADNGFNSLAITLSLNIDNRSGFYDCAVTHTHKHTDALDEIDAWMKWLKAQGTNKVILAGHSRGGNQTAWYAAERNSDMISKLILIAPQVWNMEKIQANYKESYNKELLPILNKAESLANNGKGDTLLSHTDFVYCKDSNVTADSFVSYYRDDPRKNTAYLINKLKKPTMVFIGTEDTVVKGLSEAMQELTSTANIQTVIIEGADHSFRDLYADELVETAIEFLEE